MTQCVALSEVKPFLAQESMQITDTWNFLMKTLKYRVRPCLTTFGQISPNVRFTLLAIVITPIVFLLQVINEPEPLYPAATQTYFLVSGVKFTTVDILFVVLLDMLLVFWGLFLTLILFRPGPGNVYDSYIFSSWMKWMMRIGSLNGLIWGLICGVSVFVSIVLVSLIMNDLTALIFDPRVAEHVADNSRTSGKVFIQFAAWAGAVIGIATFLNYIGSEWARINANRAHRTHKKNWPAIVTSRPFCIAIGIPITMAILLLRPTYLKKGALCAYELIPQVNEAVMHPIRTSTKAHREDQVLLEMYPGIWKEQN